MKNLNVASMLRGLLVVGVVLAAGVIPFAQSQAGAASPQPDCGPTREWICALPEGDVLFEGTVCEKLEFEKNTGAVCSPV